MMFSAREHLFLPFQTENRESWQRPWPHTPCWTSGLPAASFGWEWPFCKVPPLRQSANHNLTQTKCVGIFLCLSVVKLLRDLAVQKNYHRNPKSGRQAWSCGKTNKYSEKFKGICGYYNTVHHDLGHNIYPFKKYILCEVIPVTHMTSEASWDDRIFFSLFSSAGILSRIWLNLRIAYEEITNMLIS